MLSNKQKEFGYTKLNECAIKYKIDKRTAAKILNDLNQLKTLWNWINMDEFLNEYLGKNKTNFKEESMEETNDVVEETSEENKDQVCPAFLEGKKIFFFDTETSGFIKKKLPSNHPEQAWCIQIGALLTDSFGEVLETLNLLIQPEGRYMHPKALETHGIELDYAQENGIAEVEAAELFGIMLRKADLIVCHNYSFDWAHIVAVWERNLNDLSDESRSAFYMDIPYICTMKDKKVNAFCGLKNKAGRPKWPKLDELHNKLFEYSFDEQHDAMADVSATKKCFFGLVNQEIITG